MRDFNHTGRKIEVLGDGGELLAARPLSRQPGDPDLELAARLEGLVWGDAVQLRQQVKRPAVEARRSVADEGPGAAP